MKKDKDKYVAEIGTPSSVGQPELEYTYAYSHAQAWRNLNVRYPYPYYQIHWVQNMRTGEQMEGDMR